jgi:invasion protein IalB
MDYRIASARPLGRLLAAAGLAFALALSTAPAALAQTPAAKPADKKPAAKPAAAQKPAPAAKPGEAAPPQQAVAPTDQPQIMYSPWVKLCGKGTEADAKQVCTTMKDARTEDGRPIIIVQIFEPEGVDKKILRAYFPLGMSLKHGTRMIIDQSPPATAGYVICVPGGCIADYEINAATIAQLKKSQNLTLQAVNMSEGLFSIQLPLADFAKANEGPPTDPKVVEEQNRKLQDALQKKAAEAQKKLESQQPVADKK